MKRTKSNLFGQVLAMTKMTKDQTWRLNVERFSSRKGLLQVQSWVKRFINNSRMKKEVRFCGSLTPEELEETELDVIRASQMEAFPQEYGALFKQKEIPKSSKIFCLNPVLDEDKLIRCNGRVSSV